MKKEIIVCDKCKKEMEAKKSIYATVFINSNGLANDRCDICIDCWHEMCDYSTEKVGAEK